MADPQSIGLFGAATRLVSSISSTPVYEKHADSKIALSATPPPAVKDAISRSDSDVEININTVIREKYKGLVRSYDTLPRKTVNEIVIHGTGGGSYGGILSWMIGEPGKEAERAKEYKRGIALFHYLVGRNANQVTEVISPESSCFHSSSGEHDYETVGIELVNPDPNNKSPFTDAQYHNLFELIFKHLLEEIPTITRITEHAYNAQKYKGMTNYPCAGSFDFDRLRKQLTTLGFTYKTWGYGKVQNLIYDIKKA